VATQVNHGPPEYRLFRIFDFHFVKEYLIRPPVYLLRLIIEIIRLNLLDRVAPKDGNKKRHAESQDTAGHNAEK
jgi:hypothetical protein